MTTPTKNTPYGIITDALFDAGLIGTGVEPSSEVLASYMGRLNDLVNFFCTQGLKLFLLVDTSVPLVASQQKYRLGPTGDVVMTKPLRVLQAYYLNSSSVKRPLNPMSWSEWLLLGDTTVTGDINSYFVDKQPTYLDVYCYQIPNTTAALGTLHLLLETQATNPVELDDTMSFPQEWRMALRWGLADDICTGQPKTIMDRCAQKAALYRTALEDWDVEDASTSFEPDAQSYPTGGFK